MKTFFVAPVLVSLSFAYALAQNISNTTKGTFTLNRSVSTQFYPTNPAIATLIVSNNSFLPQGLWQPPDWSFSIGFEWNTFLLNNGMDNIRYQGTLADGSKLPDWITFNKNDITFQGSPPVLKAYRTYEIALRACNDHGLELGHELFNFTIATRDLSVNSTTISPLNLVAGSPFSLSLGDLLLPYLQIDGEPALAKDVSSLNFSVPVSSPSWVSCAGGKLVGTAPATSSGSLTVTVHDGLSGAGNLAGLAVTLPIELSAPYFSTTNLPPQFISTGQSLRFSLAPYLNNITSASDVVFNVTYQPKTTDWLTFDVSSPILHGTVPNTPPSDHVNVTFKAWDRKTNMTSSTSLLLSIDTVSTSSDHTPSSTGSSGLSSHSKIIIGAIVGILGGFILMCCALALVRHSVGQKAEDSKVRSGRRASSSPKEYVIDQLASPYHDHEKYEQARAFVPPDLESHSGSVGTGDILNAVPHEPAAVHTATSTHGSSARMTKRDFFKPALYHPARFLRSQATSDEATRKVSGSSVRDMVQRTLSAFRKPRDRPEISKPFPYTGHSTSSERLATAGSSPVIAGGAAATVPSGSGRSLAKDAPPVPSRTVHSFGAAYSSRSQGGASAGGGSAADVAAAFASLQDLVMESEGSLEGGISNDGHAGAGLVDDHSHRWVRREGSHTPGAGRSREGTPDVYGAGRGYGHVQAPAKAATRAGTPGPAMATMGTATLAAAKPLPADPSREELDEGVVQLAYSVNVKDRTSEPKLRRYSSLNGALEDPNRFTAHTFQSSYTVDPHTSFATSGGTGSGTGGSSGSGSALPPQSNSSGIGMGRPAVVMRDNAERKPVYAAGSAVRQVSNRVEMGNATVKNSAGAKSSHAIPQAVSGGKDQGWVY